MTARQGLSRNDSQNSGLCCTTAAASKGKTLTSVNPNRSYIFVDPEYITSSAAPSNSIGGVVWRTHRYLKPPGISLSHLHEPPYLPVCSTGLVGSASRTPMKRPPVLRLLMMLWNTPSSVSTESAKLKIQFPMTTS